MANEGLRTLKTCSIVRSMFPTNIRRLYCIDDNSVHGTSGYIVGRVGTRTFVCYYYCSVVHGVDIIYDEKVGLLFRIEMGKVQGSIPSVLYV